MEKTKIISIYSGIGGVGKSVITKELGYVLKHNKNNRVLLIDFDLYLGDLYTMLGINSEKSLTELIKDIQKNIIYNKEEIKEKYIIEIENGIDLLCHKEYIDEEKYKIRKEDIISILDSVKDLDYDFIIIDLGNNSHEYTIECLKKSDEVLLISTLDISSLNDINFLLNLFHNINFDISKIKIVINKFKDKSNIDINELETFFKIPIIECIPEFNEIRNFNNKRKSTFNKIFFNKKQELERQEFINKLLSLADKI